MAHKSQANVLEAIDINIADYLDTRIVQNQSLLQVRQMIINGSKLPENKKAYKARQFLKHNTGAQADISRRSSKVDGIDLTPQALQALQSFDNNLNN